MPLEKKVAITIVLSDGDPDGIRSAEMGFSMTKVIAFRRNQLDKVCSQFGSEIKKHGVYLLYGQDPNSDKDFVYIGQSADVASRLKCHNSNSKDPKDYWLDTLVMISKVSKDDDLIKSHVEYVEAKLIAAASHNVSWRLVNEKLVSGKPPKAATLPEPETIKMSDFIEQGMVLARTLGCDIFKATSGKLTKEPVGLMPDETLDSPEFHHIGPGFDARAIVSGVTGDWIVKASSCARISETKALSNGVKKLRAQLVDAGILVEKGKSLVFQEDCAFSSPSTAANVVGGSSTNGRLAWKLPTGAKFADWESAKTEDKPKIFALE